MLERRSFAQKREWTKFRKLLAKSAKELRLDISPIIWNGIRNAWFDGYNASYRLNKQVWDDAPMQPR